MRQRWPLRGLLRAGRAVLPVYMPQRAGWVVAARQALLVTSIVVAAFVYGVMSAIFPPSWLLGAAMPLALMALLVVWALPQAKAAPTRALQIAFVALFVCLILWPKYIAITVGGLPSISVRRLSAIALSLLLLISLSISKPFRQSISDVLRASPWLGRLILGYLILQAAASFLSVAPIKSLTRLINTESTTTAAFFAALWLFGQGRKDIAWFARTLAPIVLILITIGFLESRVQHILWINSIPSLFKMDSDVMDHLLQPHVRKWYRVVATYTTPLVYGEFLALCSPLVIYMMLNAKTWRSRLIWGAFDVALFCSVILSTARLSLIGFFLAHLAVGLLWGLRRWRNTRSDIVGISASLMYPAVLAAFMVAVMVVPALHVRVLGGGDAQSSNDARHAQFQAAVPVIERRPILGYGLGEGARAIGWTTPEGFLTIDLGYVSMAADYGLPALACFVGFLALSIVSLIRDGLRDVRQAFPVEFALAIGLMIIAFTRTVLAQGDNEPMFVVYFALTLATLYWNKRRREEAALAHGIPGTSTSHA